MNRPILFKGIDVAVPLTYSQCKALKTEKYRFVCRYYTDYSNPSSRWKLLSRNEAILISKAGLDIVAVYQTSGFASKRYLRETGKEDCINAIKCANLIRQPYNTTIYFAVESELKDVSEYFLGITEEMNSFKKSHNCDAWNIGVYGSYNIVNNIYKKYDVLDCWQSTIGSNHKIFDKAHLLQYKFRFPACTIDEIDEDLAFSPYFGQFKI